MLVFISPGFPSGAVVKNPPANAGDTGDVGSIPGSGRSPGKGNGNPLQYSMLWRADRDPLPRKGPREWITLMLRNKAALPVTWAPLWGLASPVHGVLMKKTIMGTS